MKLRVGLIGLGDVWQTCHRPALRMLHDRFDVRAVFSTISKLAENSAAEFQADPVDGYRALVSRCDIDAVMILERSWLGWLPALAACEAGKAVYWAGDLNFDTIRDGDFRDAIEKSGVAFMTEFPRRFAPATLRLKELIATRLGQPRLVFCHRRLRAPDLVTGRTDNTTDLAHREMIELIDWCRYVVGREPTSVTSNTHLACGPEADEHCDYRSLSLQFSEADGHSAVTAQLSCGNYVPASWPEAANFRPPAAMQIVCERGMAFVDLPMTVTWFDEAGRHLESLDNETPVGEQLLTQFHRAVTSLVRNLGDLNDAYRASSILAASCESATSGRRIDL